MRKFFNENTFFIKAMIIASMAIVALLIDKKNLWYHWTWIAYFSLTLFLLKIEFYEHKTKKMCPIDKAKKYLFNFDSWIRSSTNNYMDYYEPDPEFTTCTNEEDTDLGFDQEWTRGEIGAHYTSGNGAYYREIYFSRILLRQIHIVIFDGGKKTIVAPNWEPIGNGRVYYYLQDSIEYAYQKYHSHQYRTDNSEGIRQSDEANGFDIPVFKNEKELKNFIEFCAEPQNKSPETDKGKQNILFYALLKKYKKFRNQNI